MLRRSSSSRRPSASGASRPLSDISMTQWNHLLVHDDQTKMRAFHMLQQEHPRLIAEYLDRAEMQNVKPYAFAEERRLETVVEEQKAKEGYEQWKRERIERESDVLKRLWVWIKY